MSARTAHARELFAPLGPDLRPRRRRPLARPGPALAPLPRARASRATAGTCSTSRPGPASSRPSSSRRGFQRHRARPEPGDARRRATLGSTGARSSSRPRPRRCPFADAAFDHLTFTYLLRYVDDPGATLAELARVVRPGGVVASLEFGVPDGLARPLVGALRRRGAAPRRSGAPRTAGGEVGGFLGGSIRDFWRRYPLERQLELWRAAGLRGIEVRRLSLGGGVVIWGTQAVKTETGPSARPAFYALAPGGWRDYVTLLHPPYTAWHLSYVVIGGCLAPAVAWGRLGAAVAAFALAVGIGAHALDELRGRPLRTRIPDRVLVALAVVSIAAACAIGLVGAVAFRALARAARPGRRLPRRSPTTSSSPAAASTPTSGSGSPGAASRCSAATRRSPGSSSVAARARRGVRRRCSPSPSARSRTTSASCGAAWPPSRASSSSPTASREPLDARPPDRTGRARAAAARRRDGPARGRARRRPDLAGSSMSRCR